MNAPSDFVAFIAQKALHHRRPLAELARLDARALALPAGQDLPLALLLARFPALAQAVAGPRTEALRQRQDARRRRREDESLCPRREDEGDAGHFLGLDERSWRGRDGDSGQERA